MPMPSDESSSLRRAMKADAAPLRHMLAALEGDSFERIDSFRAAESATPSYAFPFSMPRC